MGRPLVALGMEAGEEQRPHPRKSFTYSAVTSPVVSSVVSPLVAESTDTGESVVSGGSAVSAGRSAPQYPLCTQSLAPSGTCMCTHRRSAFGWPLPALAQQH